MQQLELMAADRIGRSGLALPCLLQQRHGFRATVSAHKEGSEGRNPSRHRSVPPLDRSFCHRKRRTVVAFGAGRIACHILGECHFALGDGGVRRNRAFTR